MDIYYLYFLKLFKLGVLFGIRNKEGLFISLPKINFDNGGNVFYFDKKNRKTKISTLIFSIHDPCKSKFWFDYLYFLDKNTNIISFKSYLEKELFQT